MQPVMKHDEHQQNGNLRDEAKALNEHITAAQQALTQARGRALDCATGNGQAAIGLAGHFREGDHIVVDTVDRETFVFRREAPVPQPA